MNALSIPSLLQTSTAIAIAYPSTEERYRYKQAIDMLKSIKAKTPDLMRADIEAQVSLADAIDEALESGEAKQVRSELTQVFQLGIQQIPVAEVDRWRKLRAIPQEHREEYYLETPKPSRNNLLNWWANHCIDSTCVEVVEDDEPEKVELVAESVCDLGELPENHFGCVYADPPWQYGNQATRASTDNHYNTMSIKDLCAMPVESLVADDAHLHLWTTNAFIREAFQVIEAWGFEYRSMFIWCKPQMGIGNYWRVSHEIMLLGIRGDAKRFNDRSLKSWVLAERKKHSAKPDCVREMIEKASHGPYLELFGRKLVKGWTVFGNQVGTSYQETFC